VSSEARVGIVALLVIAIVVISWSRLGGLFKSDYQVVVCFDDLRGVPVGAPVRLYGVKIGQVSEIGIAWHREFPKKPACATLTIDRRYTLFTGDVFQVASGSLLGDKHIRVTQSVPARGQPLSKTQPMLVEGSAPSGIEALAQDAEDIAGQAKTTVANVNDMLADQQMRADLKATMANMRELSARATDIANKTLTLMDRVGPEDAQKVQAMVDNLYEVSRSLRRTAAGMNALVSTSTMPQDMEKMSQQLVEASENVRKSTEAVEGLLADPKTSDDIRTTLENVREASGAGVEVAQKASGVLDKMDSIATKVDTAIGGLPTLANPLKDVEVEGYGDARWGSGPAGRMDVAFDLYPNKFDDSFWRLGARSLGDGEKLDLQRGFALRHRGERVRAGVFEGELGVGWDRDWSSRLSSEVELIDPDEFRLDLHGFYRYNQDWSLAFGVDRTLSGTEPFIGARRYFDF